MNIDFYCPHCRKAHSIEVPQGHRNARARGRVLRSKRIRREQALAIFYQQHRAGTVRWFEIAESLSTPPPTDCWFVLFQLSYDRPCILKSSRLVTISKRTGKIVYDGDARDEATTK
jgi:hypothetical protein